MFRVVCKVRYSGIEDVQAALKYSGNTSAGVDGIQFCHLRGGKGLVARANKHSSNVHIGGDNGHGPQQRLIAPVVLKAQYLRVGANKGQSFAPFCWGRRKKRKSTDC